jgi:putative salt-induced outer membrane protein YdiY
MPAMEGIKEGVQNGDVACGPACRKWRAQLRRELRIAVLRLISLVAPVVIARADEVVLNNGDHVSGKAHINADSVSLSSDVLGELRIPRTAIKLIRLQEPDSLVASGSSSKTPNTKHGPDAASSVTETREVLGAASSPASASSPIEKFTTQPAASTARLPTPSWNVGFATGFTAARGNKSINNLNFSVTTTRSSDRNRISLSLNSLFSKTATSTQPLTRTNVIRSGARYERNVTPILFAFGLANFDVDQQQQLDLRSVLGAGLGCRIAEGRGVTFQVFGGTSFNREAFATTADRVTGEFLAGQTFTYKFAEQGEFSERLTVFPNYTSLGDVRLTFESTALMKLNRWLGWETKVDQVFLSNPPLLAERNDVIVTTGLRLTYGRDGAKFNPRSTAGPFDERKR